MCSRGGSSPDIGAGPVRSRVTTTTETLVLAMKVTGEETWSEKKHGGAIFVYKTMILLMAVCWDSQCSST